MCGVGGGAIYLFLLQGNTPTKSLQNGISIFTRISLKKPVDVTFKDENVQNDNAKSAKRLCEKNDGAFC